MGEELVSSHSQMGAIKQVRGANNMRTSASKLLELATAAARVGSWARGHVGRWFGGCSSVVGVLEVGAERDDVGR